MQSKDIRNVAVNRSAPRELRAAAIAELTVRGEENKIREEAPVAPGAAAPIKRYSKDLFE
jgi:hypothetical protein